MTSVGLRRWREGDAAALVRIALETPELGWQTDGAPLRTEADARRYISSALAPADDDRLVFAIVQDDVPVGTVGISGIGSSHGVGWAWYWLTTSARGQGLAARALVTAIAAAFDRGLARVESAHRTNNPASCRVATAAGHPAEGIARSAIRHGDQRFDVERHGRLAADPPVAVEGLPVLT